MPAIVTTAKQVIEDYGVFEGACLGGSQRHGHFCNRTVQTLQPQDIRIGKSRGHTGSGAHEY